MSLEETLKQALGSKLLEVRLTSFGAPFLERYAEAPGELKWTPEGTTGVARLLSSHAEAARFLSHRHDLAVRLAGVGPQDLEGRGGELERLPLPDPDDLEGFLDGLRILHVRFVPGTPPLPPPGQICGPDPDPGSSLGCDIPPAFCNP